jgi:dihydrofolate reductase
MRKVVVFNHVTLDGYFVDGKGDMSWAHKNDPEWNAFMAENAKGNGTLVFGRITYDLMVSWWPTPLAMQQLPDVAKGMNDLQKLVFSRTLETVTWKNTRLVQGELGDEIRKLKKEDGPDMVILGSGSIVAQLAQHNLIDDYQIVLCPTALGSGRTMFEGLKSKMCLKLTKSRTFSNGNLFLNYQPAS